MVETSLSLDELLRRLMGNELPSSSCEGLMQRVTPVVVFRQAGRRAGDPSQASRTLNRDLAAVGVKSKQVKTRTVLAFGNLKAKILSPSSLSGNPNEDSLVSLLDAAGKRFLFAGDCTDPNEAAAGAICTRGSPVYALKVAHHGTAYSTGNAFLAQVHPGFAVISIGGDSYGYSSPETMARLKARHAVSCTTQGNGNVTVTVAKGGRETRALPRGTRLDSGVL